MFFVLLTIFTEDNTGQLTRQSISSGASSLCVRGCQTNIRSVIHVVPSFNGLYQVVLDQLLGQHPTPSGVERSRVIDFGQTLLSGAQGENSYL